MARTLLIIDDDFQNVMDLKTSLAPNELLHAFNLRDASKIISHHQLSTVVLKFSVIKPEVCFAFLTDLRAARPMPILLTDISEAADRTRAYSIGADVCIKEPVDMAELTQAILAMLRRYYTLNRVAQLHEVGMAVHHKELILDPQRRSVIMSGWPVTLTAKEFDLLYFLIRHPGIVFTKEQIYEHVWQEEHPYGSRSVADHISAIRRKLSLSSHNDKYIETIYRVGYRLRL